MFTKEQRKSYRDTAKNLVFSHMAFSVWAVICLDFIITVIMGIYSVMAEERNIDLFSPDLSLFKTTLIVMLLAELVNYPLAFCARRAFLVLSRSNVLEPLPSGQVFAPFVMSAEYLLKGTAIMLLHGLLIYIGSIPLFIFALPITYAYGMAVFVFADNPEISPIKALTLSRRMMRGRKWGTFLTALPFVLLQMAVSMLLGGLPLFATLINSVIQAMEFVTIAVIYNEIKLREIVTEH